MNLIKTTNTLQALNGRPIIYEKIKIFQNANMKKVMSYDRLVS